MARSKKVEVSSGPEEPAQGAVAPARPRGGRRKPPIGDTLQQMIGAQLKAAYDDVVRQPVPDKFMDLLAALEQKQGSRS